MSSSDDQKSPSNNEDYDSRHGWSPRRRARAGFKEFDIIGFNREQLDLSDLDGLRAKLEPDDFRCAR